MTKESEIEREAVVRWLREQVGVQLGDWEEGWNMCALDAAFAIERGDHLKEDQS